MFQYFNIFPVSIFFNNILYTPLFPNSRTTYNLMEKFPYYKRLEFMTLFLRIKKKKMPKIKAFSHFS